MLYIGKQQFLRCKVTRCVKSRRTSTGIIFFCIHIERHIRSCIIQIRMHIIIGSPVQMISANVVMVVSINIAKLFQSDAEQIAVGHSIIYTIFCIIIVKRYIPVLLGIIFLSKGTLFYCYLIRKSEMIRYGSPCYSKCM